MSHQTTRPSIDVVDHLSPQDHTLYKTVVERATDNIFDLQARLELLSSLFLLSNIA